MLGNEDPPDKKMKDKEILEETLPSCRRVLMTREPMLNFADPELCGKWKAGSHSDQSDFRFAKSCYNIGLDQEIKSSFFRIQSDY